MTGAADDTFRRRPYLVGRRFDRRTDRLGEIGVGYVPQVLDVVGRPDTLTCRVDLEPNRFDAALDGLVVETPYVGGTSPDSG